MRFEFGRIMNEEHTNESPLSRATICDITDKKALARAGARDLVALKGNPPIIKQLKELQWLGSAIVGGGEMIHVHGDSGTGKNAVIEAITCDETNWRSLCEHLGVKYLPIKLHAIEMSAYETVSEIYYRRSLKNGETWDEPSAIIQAIREAVQLKDEYYHCIWLREIGRCPTAAVQGGLLNLMTRGLVCLPNGEVVSGAGIAWIADSNYHVDDASTHILVTQDTALIRRWSVNITVDYMDPEQEVEILLFHMNSGYIPKVEKLLIYKVVELGKYIREERKKGSLTSLAPPSLYGFASFLRAAFRHPQMSLEEIAENTLLGAASGQDREQVRALFADVFGIQKKNTASAAVGEI
jgi:hypothetical protein